MGSPDLQLSGIFQSSLCVPLKILYVEDLTLVLLQRHNKNEEFNYCIFRFFFSKSLLVSKKINC